LVIVTGSTDDSGNSFSFTGYSSKEYVSISKLGFIRSRASDLNGANIHFIDNGGTLRMEMAVNTSSMTWYSHALASTFMVFQHTTGNVGIGTTSPGAKLHVDGGNVIVNNGSSDTILSLETDAGGVYDPIFQMGSGQNTIASEGFEIWYANNIGDVRLSTTYNDAAASIRFLTATGASKSTSNERMIITGAGNVGIGTTSPSDILHVYKSGANTRMIVGNNANYDQYIYFQGNNDWSIGIDASNSNAFTLSNYSTIGTNDRITVTTAGNVGIGTTAPSGKLHVYGGSFITDLDATYHQGILNELVSTYVSRTKFGRWNTSSNLEIYYDIAGTEEARITRNYSVAVLKFDRAGTTDMIINGSGNVGIGTTSPGAKLDVAGDAKFGGTSTYNAITINNNSNTGGGGVLIQRNGVNQMYVGALGWYQGTSNSGAVIGTDNSSYPIVFYTNVERMRITGGGNVGIGTDSPSQNLHVAGNIRVTGAYYDSNNEAGTSGQVLSSTGSGTDWVTPATTTASSLYDLLPAARVAYNWTGQVVNDTWTTIFSKSDNILTTGTWMVKMYVNDFAVGGGHYQYVYSGIMTWEQGTVNQTGEAAFSEIYLHRMGHAANASVLYLRTAESGAAASNLGYFQIKGNYSNTSNQTIQFQFVKIF
jgi:hypothetical protein